jgi:hypothetical protein
VKKNGTIFYLVGTVAAKASLSKRHTVAKVIYNEIMPTGNTAWSYI